MRTQIRQEMSITRDKGDPDTYHICLYPFKLTGKVLYILLHPARSVML